MKKTAWIITLLAVVSASAMASTWTGNAAAGGRSEFPGDSTVLRAASNSFPEGTVLTVTNPRGGLSTRVTVTGRLEAPGVFLLIEEDAAVAIGLPLDHVLPVRVTPDTGVVHQDSGEQASYALDRDFNPAAGIPEDQLVLIPRGSTDEEIRPSEDVEESIVPPEEVLPPVDDPSSLLAENNEPDVPPTSPEIPAIIVETPIDVEKEDSEPEFVPPVIEEEVGEPVPLIAYRVEEPEPKKDISEPRSFDAFDDPYAPEKLEKEAIEEYVVPPKEWKEPVEEAGLALPPQVYEIPEEEAKESAPLPPEIKVPSMEEDEGTPVPVLTYRAEDEINPVEDAMPEKSVPLDDDEGVPVPVLTYRADEDPNDSVDTQDLAQAWVPYDEEQSFEKEDVEKYIIPSPVVTESLPEEHPLLVANDGVEEGVPEVIETYDPLVPLDSKDEDVVEPEVLPPLPEAEDGGKIVYFLSPAEPRPPEPPANSEQDELVLDVNEVPETLDPPVETDVEVSSLEIPSAVPGRSRRFVQVAAYRDPSILEDAAKKLANSSPLYPLSVADGEDARGPIYRLLIGPLRPAETGIVLDTVRAGAFPDAFPYSP